MRTQKTKPSRIQTVTDHRLELAQWACVAVIGCTLLGAIIYLIVGLV